jgi:hypothetical protein
MHSGIELQKQLRERADAVSLPVQSEDDIAFQVQ